MKKNILSSFEKLKNYCEKEKFKGWDPYDGLNSKVFQKTPIFKNIYFFRLAWIQLFKRNPINLRKLLFVEKDGKLHLIGMSIGKYKNVNDWKSIVSNPLSKIINQFGKVFVGTYGDKSIINTVLSLSEKVKIQFDIWYVFHQMKYYLWADGLAKDYRSKIISHL